MKNLTVRNEAKDIPCKSDVDGKAAGNHTHPAATQSAAGLMSAADKKKLDGGYLVKSDSNGLYVEY